MAATGRMTDVTNITCPYCGLTLVGPVINGLHERCNTEISLTWEDTVAKEFEIKAIIDGKNTVVKESASDASLARQLLLSRYKGCKVQVTSVKQVGK